MDPACSLIAKSHPSKRYTHASAARRRTAAAAGARRVPLDAAACHATPAAPADAGQHRRAAAVGVPRMAGMWRCGRRRGSSSAQGRVCMCHGHVVMRWPCVSRVLLTRAWIQDREKEVATALGASQGKGLGSSPCVAAHAAAVHVLLQLHGLTCGECGVIGC